MCVPTRILDGREIGRWFGSVGTSCAVRCGICGVRVCARACVCVCDVIILSFHLLLLLVGVGAGLKKQNKSAFMFVFAHRTDVVLGGYT